MSPPYRKSNLSSTFRRCFCWQSQTPSLLFKVFQALWRNISKHPSSKAHQRSHCLAGSAHPIRVMCLASAAACTSAGALPCTPGAGQPAPPGATCTFTELRWGGAAVVQLSSKCFLTGNSSVKFSLLCCAEVIQNYDLQHLPTHRVATPGSRPPNLSFSAYRRLLQGQVHVLSLCTTG